MALGAWRPGLDLEGLEEVDIVVHDVRWDGGRIDRLTIRAQNVNLEGGVVSSVVAGPIDLAGEVDQATVDELLERYEAPVQVILDGTDRATVHQGGRLTATVSAELDGDEVTFPIHEVRWAGIPLPFVHRFLTTRRATVPPLPRGVRLTGVSSAPGVLRGTAVLDEFREPLVVESVLRAASTVGQRVVLNRTTTPRQALIRSVPCAQPRQMWRPGAARYVEWSQASHRATPLTTWVPRTVWKVSKACWAAGSSA